jgi:hypothetical protein
MTTITEVLKSLDHDDDTLWTAAGLPKVEVIQELTGDEDLSRKEIDEVAPGFERFESFDPRAVDDLQDEGSVDGRLETKSESEISLLRDKKSEIESLIQEKKQEKIDLDAGIADLFSERDKIINQLEVLQPKLTNEGAIREYLKRQKEISMEKYEIQQSLAKIGIQKVITRASKLDESLANKK